MTFSTYYCSRCGQFVTTNTSAAGATVHCCPAATTYAAPISATVVYETEDIRLLRQIAADLRALLAILRERP